MIFQDHVSAQKLIMTSRAFIFAAALILGFSMFSHRDIDPETDAAFVGALAILRMLARQSAQAAHYLEILILLQDVITQQRQLLTAQDGQRRSDYVSRIFSLNDGVSKSSSQTERDQSISGSNALNRGPALHSWTSQEEGVSFPDWGGMDLPLWDMFPFTEPGSYVL